MDIIFIDPPFKRFTGFYNPFYPMLKKHKDALK
jgi:16S rRNA G966 N2-methylase RsmD